MTTTTFPCEPDFTIPFKDRPETGPDYHRNGVSGIPFVVEVNDGNVLRVAFSNMDEASTYGTVHYAGLSDLRHWAEIGARDDGLRHVSMAPNGRVVIVFDDKVDDSKRTMAAIVDTTSWTGANKAVAVFQVDFLPDVRFGHNSWRGDNYYGRITDWLSEAHAVVARFTKTAS